MSGAATPVLDSRQHDRTLQQLARRRPAFVPGWGLEPLGPGTALEHVFARFAQDAAAVVNRAPDKNELAFFELLGLELLPAHAARVPVVFRPLSAPRGALRGLPSTVPARTRVGANVPGQSQPIVFETEKKIGLAVARLVEVVSLWPGRDAYADHSAPYGRGTPFTLFKGLQPVRHEFYLAHETLFALAGQ